MLVNFTLDGLSSAMVPKVFGLLKEPPSAVTQKEINKYYSSFNLLTLLIIPINIFVLPLLLPLFISDEKYLQAFLYFGIISAGLATRSVMNLFIFPIYYLKQTTKLLWVNGISAFMQVVITYVMIHQFGYTARRLCT